MLESGFLCVDSLDLLDNSHDKLTLCGRQHSKLSDMSEPKTLAEVLAALPDEERIILMMHYLRSMPPSEIAQKLGVPERSVAAVIATGKARLSRTLGL